MKVCLCIITLFWSSFALLAKDDINENFSGPLSSQWDKSGSVIRENEQLKLTDYEFFSASIEYESSSSISSVQADITYTESVESPAEYEINERTVGLEIGTEGIEEIEAEIFIEKTSDASQIFCRVSSLNEQNWEETEYHSFSLPALTGTQYNFRIEVDGTLIQFFKDGSLINQYNHTTSLVFKETEIRSFGAVAHIDNVNVSFNNSTPIQQTAPKVSSLKINKNNKIGTNIVPISFRITGEATQYSIYWLDGDSENELTSGSINNDAIDDKGFYNIEDVDIEDATPIKGKKTIYARVSNNSLQSNPTKATVTLVLPKVSSVKANGNNKTGRNVVPVKFKITGDANTYSIFWIKGDIQNQIATGSINSNDIDAKGLYQVDNVDIENVDDIKGKKTIYVQLTNEVGDSKAAKCNITLSLPKVSSVKVNGNNKTGRNVVPVKFKITGDADSYAIFWMNGEFPTPIKTGPINSNDIDAKGLYQVDNVDIGIIPEVKGKKTLYVELENEVGYSKVAKCTVSLLAPSITAMGINGTDKEFSEGETVTLVHSIKGSATHYRITSTVFSDENDPNAADWQIYNGTITVADFTSETISLQMKNDVAVSKVRSDTIKMNLRPEEWEGTWEGYGSIVSTTFDFDIASSSNFIFTFTKTGEGKLSIRDAAGNDLIGDFDEQGNFEAEGYDNKRGCYMVLSGQLDVIDGEYETSIYDIDLVLDYDNILVNFEYSLDLYGDEEESIEDFQNRIVIFKPGTDTISYVLVDGQEYEVVQDIPEEPRFLSVSKQGSVVTATDLITNERYNGEYYDGDFIIQTASNTEIDKLTWEFFSAEEDENTANGSFLFEEHDNPVHFWEQGQLYAFEYKEGNDIKDDTYPAGDLGVTISESFEGPSVFPSQSVEFIVSGHNLTIRLNGYGNITGKIYNGIFKASDGTLTIAGELKKDETCTGSYEYDDDNNDIFETGTFERLPLNVWDDYYQD